MFKFHKYYKKIKENKIRFKDFVKENYIDESGYATFNITKNKEDIYSNFSSKNNTLISSSFIEEIENYTYPIPYTYPIKLIINSNDDLKDLQNDLHNYYKMQALSYKRDLTINKIKSLTLLLLGSILLLIYFIFSQKTNFLYSEILSIIATFSIWESADIFFLERQNIKIEIANKLQLELALVIVEKKQNI